VLLKKREERSESISLRFIVLIKIGRREKNKVNTLCFSLLNNYTNAKKSKLKDGKN